MEKWEWISDNVPGRWSFSSHTKNNHTDIQQVVLRQSNVNKILLHRWHSSFRFNSSMPQYNLSTAMLFYLHVMCWHMRPDPNYHPCFSTRKLKQTPPNVVSVTLSELRWHCMPLGSASHSVQQVQWSQIKWGHVTQLGNPALLGLTYQSSYRSVHRGTGVVQ